MSSAPRGLAPREGLECLVGEDGLYWATGRATQQDAGKQVWGPPFQNTNSSPRAQGALGLGLAAKPKGKCGAPRAPTARDLGRRVAADWTWVSPLPHAPPISAWLGGHEALHSYSLLAARVLPVPLSSSKLCSRFQSDLSSAPSIAMAPTSREKGKNPVSSSSLSPAIEPPSAGRWCSIWRPWARSAPRSPPASTSAERRWLGPHPMPPST